MEVTNQRRPTLPKLRITGRVKIYENGVLVWDSPNLVVDGGLNAVATLLANADSNKAIVEMAFGDSNGGTCSVTSSDSALANEIIRKSTTGVVSQNSVTFSAVIDEGEGNGSGTVNYNEAGLFCQDGSMFSKICHPTRTKTDSVALRYEWTITIDNA